MTRIFSFLKDAFQPVEDESPPQVEVVPTDRFFPWGTQWLSCSLNLHSCLIGTTRSGKSTLMTYHQQHVLPAILEGKNTRAAIFDPKTDAYPILDGMGLSNVIINLHPYDARSYGWMIDEDVEENRECEEVSEGLVPKEASKDGKESFFTTTTRNLVTATLSAFTRRGFHWTLRDVLWTLLYEQALAWLLNQFPDTALTYKKSLEQREGTAQDIQSTIINLVNRFGGIAALWYYAEREGRTFSIKRWLKSNQILLFPGPRGEGDPLHTLNQLMFHRLASALLGLPPASDFDIPPWIWLYIDELRQMGNLALLPDLLFKGAGGGVRLVLGAQGLEGLYVAYGQHLAEEILSMCANKGFLRTDSDITAEWMRRQIHHQIILEEEITRGKDFKETVAYRHVERPVVESIRFMDLETPEIGENLTGYFLAPSLMAEGKSIFFGSFPKDRLFYGDSPLISRKGKEPRFLPRPAKQQILPLWDAADLTRLGFPTYLLPQSTRGQFSDISRAMFE